jgi:raffinose/stachyose/melibiose transport system permease protein
MTASTIQLPASKQPARRRPGVHSRSRGGAGPATYFIALLLVSVMLVPILYIVLGGFRTNAQITTDPAGFPSPWQLTNYLEVLSS